MIRCSLPLPHGVRGLNGKCRECCRLRAIAYRDRRRINRYTARPVLGRKESLETIINRALLKWRLPDQKPLVELPRINPSHFAPSDPRTSAIGRMGAKVSPWRFGIKYSKPEWLK